MRASGMPVATMRAPTADAMAKQLFMEEDWPAELAVAAARAAKGDWHQLRARKQRRENARAKMRRSQTPRHASWLTVC